MTQTVQNLALANSSVFPVSDINELVHSAELEFQELSKIESLSQKLSKTQIRSSLEASTYDGIFACIFSGVTGSVLLVNFLLELGASSVEIGLLSSIPMLANFLQPLGAYFADRTQSRHWFTSCIFAISRLFWLILILGIVAFNLQLITANRLVLWTLGIVFITHFLGALGCPSWVSWMAELVPHRLRGRYFGLRNSAANLTNLLSIPLLGLIVANWRGGTIQGYGVVLGIAVIAGIISLSFQWMMTDVNPQASQHSEASNRIETQQHKNFLGVFKDQNFVRFLLYFGLWMFAVNLSNPFFNFYLMSDLGLKVSWVTLYGSVAAGANLLMLLFWGKLADRIGNRSILVGIGVLVALTPLLWLLVGGDTLSVWVWLPLLHILSGGTWAALDLCNNNIQMEIAPKGSSTYFAIAAAVSGLFGALGTTTGGFLAQVPHWGGLPSLFALSAGLRLVALLPLILVREPKHQRTLEWKIGFKVS